MLRPINGPIDVSAWGVERLSELVSAVDPVCPVDPLTLGAVYVNRDRVYGDGPVLRGDCVRIHVQPRRFPLPSEWQSRVLFQNESFLIVNKPAGLPSHPTCDNAQDNVLAALRREFQKPVYLIHRLDIETRGLMIFAFDSESQKILNCLFSQRQVKKIYRAGVERSVGLGLHVHFQVESARAPKRLSLEGTENTRRCEMRVLSCKAQGAHFRVEMEALTGRHHQLRSQLAFLGSPILGDVLYGSTCDYPSGIALESARLEFHFKGRDYRFELPEVD